MLGSLEEEVVLEGEDADALVEKSRGKKKKSPEHPHSLKETPSRKKFKPY